MKLPHSLKCSPLALAILLFSLTASLYADNFKATNSNRVIDLSGNGRYILQRDGFTLSNMATTNLSVLDVETGLVDPVNIDPSGAFVAVDRGSISADGRYVVFEAGDYSKIYLRDREARSTRLLSVPVGGGEINGAVTLPSISPDGSRVVFFTDATNLVSATLPTVTGFYGNLILWERDTDQLSLAATTPDGDPINAGSFMDPGLCMRRFSGDSRYMVFATPATNVLEASSASSGSLILMYRKDMDTGEVVAVSTTSAGEMAAANYSYPSISADGRYVSFTTTFQGYFGTHIIPGDSATLAQEVYRKDLQTGEVLRISVTTDGNPPNAFIQGTWGRGSSPLSMNADATRIAFQSNCTNLTHDNPEGTWGVFLATVEDSGSVSIEYLSRPPSGANDVEAANPIFAATGDLMVFQTDDRGRFGQPAGDGWLFFGTAGEGANPLLGFFGDGAIDHGNGLIYSPVMGWFEFYGSTGWAYSFSFHRFIYIDMGGPGLSSASGIWFYLLGDEGGFWAFSSAQFWLTYMNNGEQRNAYVYVPSGLEGAPGWFYYYGEFNYWLPVEL